MTGKVEASTILLLVKSEATYGVDPVLAVTDALMARSFTMEPQISELDKPRIGATNISRGKTIAKVSWAVTFEVDAVGIGDPGGDYTVPRYDNLLRACSMIVTPVGAAPVTGQTYTFSTRNTTGQDSVRIEPIKFTWEDGTQKMSPMAGARFTVEFSIGVDEPGIFTFSGNALYDGDPEATVFDPDAVDYGDVVEQDDSANGKGITLQWGGQNICAKSVKITMNRVISEVPAIKGTQGVIEYFVSSSPAQVFTVEMDDIETTVIPASEWVDLLSEEKKLGILTIDTVQGTRIVFTMLQLQRGAFSFEDDASVSRLNTSWYACDATEAGDDAISIAFSRTPP